MAEPSGVRVGEGGSRAKEWALEIKVEAEW